MERGGLKGSLFNSVLDFVCVAGGAKRWRASSEGLAAQDRYYPSDQSRRDHRSVCTYVQLSDDGQPSPRQLLLARIQWMEEGLRALKGLVERIPQ